MMENSTDGDNSKPSKPPTENNPTTTETSNAGNGEKGGDIESELKGILKDNLNHSCVCALVCLIIVVLLQDGFFTMCFVGFCVSAIVNVIWKGRIDSGKGKEFLDSCKKNDVAYFLTLHYFTYDRTRKVLHRLDREAEAVKSAV